MSTSAVGLVATWLNQLAGSPSTLRQRTWAAHDLLRYAAGAVPGPDPALADVLHPVVVESWLAHTASAGASLPGQRARAATARALTAWASAHQLLAPGPVASGRLPAPAPAPTRAAGARALLAATSEGPPPGVLAAAWDRFAAHAAVQATTGARALDLARLGTQDVDLHRASLTIAGQPHELADHTRHCLARWLSTRTHLVASLTGTDPAALWLRVRPGANPRTGALAPAGLPIGERGLREAFTVTRDALALEEPAVADVQLRDLRALARISHQPLHPDE